MRRVWLWALMFWATLATSQGGLGPRVTPTGLNVPLVPPQAGYHLDLAFPGIQFDQPVAILSPPGETNRLFVVERTGYVMVITNLAEPTLTVFLNLTNSVTTSFWEEGLLGMAFHPGYQTNGQFFIYRTLVTSSPASSYGFHNQLSRFTVSPDDPNKGDKDSELRLITQLDFMTHHNAGDIQFGPDGYLYLTLGDDKPGGSDLSPNRQAIDRGFFGGIIRIDVDKRPGNLPPNPHPAVTTNYFVPADNPFVGITSYQGIPVNPNEVRTEFYAIGFRNPWRMTFEPATGDLFVGDVGAGLVEEVNRVVSGGNYGWPYYEGVLLTQEIGLAPPEFTSIEPVIWYSHGAANNQGNSVIGGVFYQGEKIPQLRGRYIYGDFRRGHIWSAVFENHAPVGNSQWLTGIPEISCFGTDPRDGDVLIANFGNGNIYRLVYTPPELAPPYPQTLAETGVFSDLTLLEPAPGVIPYQMSMPFWSDYAVKRRWFTLLEPNSTFGFQKTANWTLPSGTVWVKHFEMEMTNGVPESRRRLETRLLVYDGARSYGVTYRWDPQTGEARLVAPDGMNEVLYVETAPGITRTQIWHYPRHSECISCHNMVGGWSGGFGTAQLNRMVDFGDGPTNQIQALAEAGYISGLTNEPPEWPKLVSIQDETEPLYHRVKSYLKANCSFCHQPGTLRAFWDARLETRLEDMGLVHSLNNIVVPNDIEGSDIVERLTIQNEMRMPPIGSSQIDSNAVALVRRWIASFPDAPWESSDIGSVPLEGSASDEGGVFQLSGGPGQVGGSGDAFRFMSQSQTGRVVWVAQLLEQHGQGGEGGFAGIILRENLGPQSGMAALGVDPMGTVRLVTRAQAGVASTVTAARVYPTPLWLKLELRGQLAVGSVSTNGVDWVEEASHAWTHGEVLQAGLGVTSGQSVGRMVATFANFDSLGLQWVTDPVNPVLVAGDFIRVKLQAPGASGGMNVFKNGVLLRSFDAPPYELLLTNLTVGSHQVIARASAPGVGAYESAPLILNVGPLPAYVQGVPTPGNVNPGAWQTVIGTQDYSIPTLAARSPGALIHVASALTNLISSPSFETRALRQPDKSERISAFWEDPTSILVDLTFMDADAHRVSLYFVDWNRRALVQKIEAIDPGSGRVLLTDTVQQFANGKFWQIVVRGDTRLRITTVSGGSPVLAGVFVDPFALGTPSISLTLDGGVSGLTNHVLPEPVLMQADVQSPNGAVSSVVFYVNGKPQAEVKQAPYRWTWNNVAAGDFVVSARVYDILGFSAQSSSIDFSAVTAPAAVVFKSEDATTQGDWLGRYGSEGFLLVGVTNQLPAWFQWSAQSDAQTVVWGRPESSVTRALMVPGETNRVASSYFSFEQMSFHVGINDGRPHRLSFYFLDWDNADWQCVVRFRDLRDHRLLEERRVSGFKQGAYVNWVATGPVLVEVERFVGFAILSGVFLDAEPAVGPAVSLTFPEPGSSMPVAAEVVLAASVGEQAEDDPVARVDFFAQEQWIGSSSTLPAQFVWAPILSGDVRMMARAHTASGKWSDSSSILVHLIPSAQPAAVRFSGMDSATRGTWMGRWGEEGWWIAGVGASLPSFTQTSSSSSNVYVWFPATQDPRAVQRPETESRIAAAQYTSDIPGDWFEWNIALTDGRWHQLEFYCLDWDARARKQKVEIFSVSSGSLLDEYTLEDFSEGRYLRWYVRGDIKVRFTSINMHAVLSAVFWDPTDPFERWILDRAPAEDWKNMLAGGGIQNSDVDGDGLSTLMEYVLGRDPVTAESESAFSASIREGSLHLVLKRSKLVPGVQLVFEKSRDLVSWEVVNPPELVLQTTELDAGYDQVDVSIPVDTQAEPQQFLRIRAVR